MRWSFKIATVFGIPIKVHATFLLFLVVIAFSPPGNSGILTGSRGLAVVGLVFLCVLLHELGHGLVAQRFGVNVDSITLLPIGGLAAMRTLPKRPGAEFCIALAGPAVSLTLAAMFGTVAYLRYGPHTLTHLAQAFSQSHFSIINALAMVNLVLTAFNLLPAFPMDGGRILRACLWSRMGFVRATRVASDVGQGLAMGLFVLAFWQRNMFLAVIALFVYLGAKAEGRAAMWHGVSADIPVGRAMLTGLERMAPTDRIDRIADRMGRTGQNVFPICENGRLLGVLTHQALVRTPREGNGDRPAADLMTTQIVFCAPEDSLVGVWRIMQARRLPFVAVMTGDELVGLITPDQVGKLGLVRR